MSKKGETQVTEPERQALAVAVEAEADAGIVNTRAQIALATAQTNKLEILNRLSKRYRLSVGDAIDPATGAITRKAP